MRQPEIQSRFDQGFGGGAAGACSFGDALGCSFGCSFGASFGASFGCSFGSTLVAAFGSIEMSSTSKMSVEFGPMGEPGAPRSPYARSEGIYSCHLEPAGMSWIA